MALCKQPVYFNPEVGLTACGQCQLCRSNRRNKKVSRFVLESRQHEHALFVTLTYDEEHLPRTIYHPKTGEVLASHPAGCVDKRVIQLFNKKLKSNVRRKQGKAMADGIRFFACGEYGEQNGRPHYHFVIWGLPYKYREHIYKAWTDPSTKKLLCDPDRLDIQIPRSYNDVGTYISSYVMKNGTSSESLRLDGRPPACFSSSQGIAKSAIPALVKSFSTSASVRHITSVGDIPRTYRLEGKEYPIDRYLQEKIIAALQIPVPIKENRQKNFQKEMSDLYARAIRNPDIPKIWKAKAIGNCRIGRHYRAEIKKFQYNVEKAQAVLNVEKRASLKKKGTSL